MAQANTNAAFDAALERLKELSSRCQTAISEQLQFDCKETTLYYGVSLAQLDRINQFTITFNMLMRCLIALQSSYEHTTYLLSVETGRYDCVVAKINATLAMRTSIESELIFVSINWSCPGRSLIYSYCCFAAALCLSCQGLGESESLLQSHRRVEQAARACRSPDHQWNGAALEGYDCGNPRAEQTSQRNA